MQCLNKLDLETIKSRVYNPFLIFSRKKEKKNLICVQIAYQINRTYQLTIFLFTIHKEFLLAKPNLIFLSPHF